MKPSPSTHDKERIGALRTEIETLRDERKYRRRKLTTLVDEQRKIMGDIARAEAEGEPVPLAKRRRWGELGLAAAKAEETIEKIDREIRANERTIEEISKYMRQHLDHTTDIMAWCKQAEPGERVVYYVGFVAREFKEITKKGQRQIEAARDLAEQGEVTLTQRRLTPGRWEYIAIKLADKKPHDWRHGIEERVSV